MSVVGPGWEIPEELCSFRKSNDLITKVRLITADHETYVDIRDWIESKEEWGRGYWIAAKKDDLMALSSALLDVVERFDG